MELFRMSVKCFLRRMNVLGTVDVFVRITG